MNLFLILTTLKMKITSLKKADNEIRSYKHEYAYKSFVISKMKTNIIKLLTLTLLTLSIKTQINSHLILDESKKMNEVDFEEKYEIWVSTLTVERQKIIDNLIEITNEVNPKPPVYTNNEGNVEDIKILNKNNAKLGKKAILIVPPLKQLPSLLRKMETEYDIKEKKDLDDKTIYYYKDFNDVKDFIRFTIVLSDLKTMEVIVKKLENIYYTIKDKNRFGKPLKSGYEDRNMVFNYEEEEITDLDENKPFEIKFELQFQLCSFNLGKAAEHVIYEVVRILDQIQIKDENGRKVLLKKSEDCFKKLVILMEKNLIKY